MRSYVHSDCTWMLSVLAYMSNVISSEFVIGYDGEFANNTLVKIFFFTCYVQRNITLYKGIDTAVGCDLFQTTPAQPEKPPTASHRYTP